VRSLGVACRAGQAQPEHVEWFGCADELHAGQLANLRKTAVGADDQGCPHVVQAVSGAVADASNDAVFLQQLLRACPEVE
jgi:hypothetical protein